MQLSWSVEKRELACWAHPSCARLAESQYFIHSSTISDANGKSRAGFDDLRMFCTS